ncbi:hypothetical protein D3C78_1208430 [compost metagenome]
MANALDLLGDRRLAQVAVQAEQLTQAGGPLFRVAIHHAEVVQLQLADQPPGDHAFGQRRARRRRAFFQRHLFDRDRVRHHEIALTLLQQHQRQIATGTQHVGGEVFQVAVPRRLPFIHQRDEHFRADIAGAGAVATGVFGQRALFAPQ